ncbi:hypothetical protein ACH5RR_019886 [Cinchona calisaya]|uniref:UFSP1/2/DUB catalytic domain-containing protein n=1 Tax=Cinchona calisaya TaxID=153742 RepID=A0ABD2ZTE9_9GENT
MDGDGDGDGNGYYSICPICYQEVPSQDIHRHANDHFAEEEISRDLEFAQQIQLPPPLLVDTAMHCQTNFFESHNHHQSGSSSRDTATRTAACEQENDVDGKFCSLISLQTKETFYRVEGGLMPLLKNCLASESESQNVTSILSGYVDHFQSREWEDVGWGCGWRNIQMLSSHLITQRQEARDVLYGGTGFVPDIASLQRWLEFAWELGFDTQGSNDFDREIYGKRNWIGTTECAALLRSFGLRAMIVDFCSQGTRFASSTSALNHGKMASKQIDGNGKLAKVYGPMDRYLSRRDNSISHEASTGCGDSTYSSAPGGKVIMDWVWSYFSDNNSTKPGSRRVVLSEKAPLYFQHDGHSRTIVGIQAKFPSNGIHQYNLLILDPAHRTEDLEKFLKQNVGWQKLIKRGIHTLKKPQYQLCFIEPGIASGEEIDRLKVLCGIHFEV